ncbi:hypothetical protein ACWGDT_20955 [Streptomyces avermitilis]
MNRDHSSLKIHFRYTPQEHAACQCFGSGRHGNFARLPRSDDHLGADGRPLDRGQLDQIDVLETLKNVTGGDEGLVVERLPCLLQGGVLLGGPLIELLLALTPTLVPLVGPPSRA